MGTGRRSGKSRAGGFPHGRKDPVLNILLLLAVSLVALWKTWPN